MHCSWYAVAFVCAGVCAFDAARSQWAAFITVGREQTLTGWKARTYAVDALRPVVVSLDDADTNVALRVVVVRAAAWAAINAAHGLSLGQEGLGHVRALRGERRGRAIDALGVVGALDHACGDAVVL
jgi:hypothetical protein